jgi:probable HAF family extracellular repeat protein
VAFAAAFIALGDLPGGLFGSHAEGVSADGMTVVGDGSQSYGFFIELEPWAFRWTEQTGMVHMPYPSNSVLTGATDAYAHEVSANGSITVGTIISESTREAEAFRWDFDQQTSIAMGDLPGGRHQSEGYDVSADGRIVVGYATSQLGRESFRSMGNTIQPSDGLGDLPGGTFDSIARAISANGLVVVGQSNSTSGPEAFRWADGVMAPLGDLPGGSFDSNALGVSADGNVVVGVGRSSSGDEAFRWQNGVMSSLGDFPGGITRSAAWDTTADGAIIVGYGTVGTPSPTSNWERAFIWDSQNGMRELQQVLIDMYGLAPQLTGWTLLQATGISANGRVVVGYANSPNGSAEAWMAILTPPGDYNVDGTVDAADYVVWRKGNGTQEGYNIWRANFGSAIGGGSTTDSAALTNVPESSGCVPLSVAILGIIVLGRLPRLSRPGPLVALLVLLPGIAGAKTPYSTIWTRQFGSPVSDSARDIWVDSLGNVYLAGVTSGSLFGSNAGGIDAFVSKFNAAGVLQWAQQFGTESNDEARGIVADGSGNVYVTGDTTGALVGMNAGGSDAFVKKFDASGNPLWARQLGSVATDYSYGIAAEMSEAVYIAGSTKGSFGAQNGDEFDGLLAKYSAAGDLEWVRQQGFDDERYYGVASDGLGNVYAAGQNARPSAFIIGRTIYDMVIVKYDQSGQIQWRRQPFYDDAQLANSVAADSLGNIYVVGITFGAFDVPVVGNSDDAFVAKFDSNGAIKWARNFGTSSTDSATDAAIDEHGNVYVIGYTYGSLAEQNQGSPTSFARSDVFLRKYDSNGNQLWTRQFGTTGYDEGLAVSYNGQGGIYIAGLIGSSPVGQPNLINNDAWVARLAPLSGDYNLDGIVEAADYVTWRDLLGQSGVGLAADGNENDVVDAGDYDVWRANFGQIVSSISNAGTSAFTTAAFPAVPEPASVMLLALAAMGICGFAGRSLVRSTAFLVVVDLQSNVSLTEARNSTVWTHQTDVGVSNVVDASDASSDCCDNFHVTRGVNDGPLGGHGRLRQQVSTAGVPSPAPQLGTVGDDVAQTGAALRLKAIVAKQVWRIEASL